MSGTRLVTGLLKILGQIGTLITLLISAAAIYMVLSSAGSNSGVTSAAWLVVSATGLTTSLWAIVGTAYYERFAESSKLTKLMAFASATAGIMLTIGGLIAPR